MEDLEDIYTKSKADGHFSKFENFSSFQNYFKDETAYIKLHAFLLSKGYSVPNQDEFLVKVSGKTSREKDVNYGIYNQPPSAVADLMFSDKHKKKLPDLLKIGTLGVPGTDEAIPALIPFSDRGGLCVSFSDSKHKQKADEILQLAAYRLLLSIPPKQAKFYIIDYEKNGASFVNLLGLDAKILEQEIWDDPLEISDGISNIKNQVPKILANNLQNKYQNLAEYNEKIEHSNQPFQFLMIANFPNGFAQESTEKLLNLIQNGNKAGVFVLMSIDKTAKPDYNVSIADFLNKTPRIELDANKIFNTGNDEIYNSRFFIKRIDSEMPVNIGTIKNELNQEVKKQKAVKIDLNQTAGEEWKESAAKGVKVPIGITESNDPIDFVFGINTDSYHALVGGATGSGKSVLLHSIIVNAAQLYSPETLQFVLLDYKEGTEFIVYDKLPHVKILSVECAREYGISVLEFLANTMTERGALFKKYGAGNLEEYIKASGETIPRYLVIIDEFQVLLSGQGSLSSKASQMIEDVTRRGRSFGVNLILATQSLADVDISTSTLGQLGLRIAMKMGESDANRILSINNSVPVGFDRPGLAVYNKQGGDNKGNVIFQSAFISKSEIADKVKQLSEKDTAYTPFKQFINNGEIFASMRNNKQLQTNDWVANNNFCDFYIGEPAYLQDEHYKLRIRKQAGSNVYIEGEVPEDIVSVFYHSFEQLIRQSSPDSQFYIFDLFDIDSGHQGQLENLATLSENVKIYSKDKPLENRLEEIKQELSLRIEEEGGKQRICIGIINGQRIRSLKKDGDYSDSVLSTALQDILKDGPDYGIHTLLHFQNSNQLSESFNQTSKTLKEFENIILLKGSKVGSYVDDYNVTEVKKEGTAYVKQPNSRYGADLINVYKK
jgi:S-DNA-T family DNA segregation ATPase FtsK/SpoIIIE